MARHEDAGGLGSLFSGELGGSPFPLYARLREIGPVVPQPTAGRPVWVVTRMAEAVQVLRDPARFTVDSRTLSSSAPVDAGASFFTDGSSMLSVDDPDHRRLRALVSKAFTPQYVEGLRSRVQEIADALLDRVQDKGHMDVVEDYAFPLPINVIAEMLGVPDSEWPRVRAWSEGLANGLGRMGEDSEGLAQQLRAFGGWAAQLVHTKREHPAGDLTSQLVGVEEEGERLSERELISMILLLIFAGHETTSNLISTGTLVLLDHPDQLARLREDLGLVPSAVEELLRFHGPAITAGPRFATEDVEVGGHQLQKGDLVMVALFSANHDDRQFTDSEDLDVARHMQRHLAFGYGIHTCLGAPLARLEGDVAFTTLLRRMPELHLAIPRESVTWQPRLNTWTLPSLPVAF